MNNQTKNQHGNFNFSNFRDIKDNYRNLSLILVFFQGSEPELFELGLSCCDFIKYRH